MNPVLILTKNNLEMNKRCVASALAQDIPAEVFLSDNLSTDGTQQWAANSPDVTDLSIGYDLGVSEGWNYGLAALFTGGKMGRAEHVLVLNSDTIIPSWFYSTLLSYEGPFITGVSVGSMEEIASPPPRKELAPCPDMSAFLIRRECWEKVGRFDGTMRLYASDLDYHLRAHRAGVRLMNAGVPFYHERSSTINLASPDDRRVIQIQADADREAFRQKWNVSVGGQDYGALFDEKNFGIELWQKRMLEHNHL